MKVINWKKRIALFVVWPAVVAFMFLAMALILVAAWPLILTPWFPFEGESK